MKRFFYVTLVAFVLFAAKSCDKNPEPDSPLPPVIVEDTSGLCTIRFINTDVAGASYDVWIDNQRVIERMPGGNAVTNVENVRAGTKTLYAEQQSGHSPTEIPKRKEERVKILTDSVYTWLFP